MSIVELIRNKKCKNINFKAHKSKFCTDYMYPNQTKQLPEVWLIKGRTDKHKLSLHTIYSQLFLVKIIYLYISDNIEPSSCVIRYQHLKGTIFFWQTCLYMYSVFLSWKACQKLYIFKSCIISPLTPKSPTHHSFRFSCRNFSVYSIIFSSIYSPRFSHFLPRTHPFLCDLTNLKRTIYLTHTYSYSYQNL